MNREDGTISFVESIIDEMVESDAGVSDAVSQVLDRSDVEQSFPEAVEISLEEGEEVVCPICEGDALEFGMTETEEGDIPTIHCQSCDTGFLAEEDDDEDEEDEVMEGEIDEIDPRCPVCESDNLEGEIHEADGEEIPVIVCEDCGSGFVPVDEEG